MIEITNFSVKILEILLLSFGYEARARGVDGEILSPRFKIPQVNGRSM